MLSNLRTLLIGIAISLAIAITAALFLPSTWRVEVSSVIQASPEEVHPFVSDFQQWGRWAQWSEAEDPNVQLESGMENDTPVQRVRVRGEDRAVLVMDHRDAQGVQVSAKGRVQGVQTVRYEAMDPGRTRVRWVDEGRVDVPLVGGLIAWDIAGRLEEHHETALRKLKALAESVAAGADTD